MCNECPDTEKCWGTPLEVVAVGHPIGFMTKESFLEMLKDPDIQQAILQIVVDRVQKAQRCVCAADPNKLLNDRGNL